MRILHFIYDHIRNPWVGGGGAARAYELNRRLSASHEVTIVSGRYPGIKDYREGNLSFHFVGTDAGNYVLSTFCYAVQAVRYLVGKAAAFDIIVEDFAPYNPVFSFLGKKDAVLQLHQKEGLAHLKRHAVLGLPFIMIESLYHRFFENIVIVSEYNRVRYGISGNAAVIPNGFAPDLIGQESADGDYMLFLGRLHMDQKGLDILRGALNYTGDKKLLIAGDGKDRERTARLFHEKVRAGTVQFTGFVSGGGKMELLKNCKFFLMPSRYEGLPLTLIEAAACGKPVIVSDIPELRYAVDAGFGISFKTGDAGDLARKITLLYDNEALRRELGQRAREYAKDFTWDNIAAAYESYLLGVAAAR